MERENLRNAADRVYGFLMHSEPSRWGGHEWIDWAMNVDRWDWNSGVGIVAAADYGALTGDDRALGEVADWVARNKGQADAVKVINSMAPYAAFPVLHERTGDPFYRNKAREVAEWMIERSPRTRSGAFEHTVTEDAVFPEQIWADTVFMAVLFLARAGRMLQDRRLSDEALKQTLLHLRALQDERTGLLYHGWNCAAGHWMSAARWNRANAWNACAVPMILEERDKAGFGDAEEAAEIRERYHRLAEALAVRQRPGGLWPTVLDRPDFYDETSGSAGIAFGIARAARIGLVPASLAAGFGRAVEAVVLQIGDDGAVAGVSGGTPVLPSVEAYNEVPTFPTLYGQGLTLYLLAEAIDRDRR